MLGKRESPTGGASFHSRGAFYSSQKASTAFSFSQSGFRQANNITNLYDFNEKTFPLLN